MLTCLVGTEDAVKLTSCILTAMHSYCVSLMLILPPLHRLVVQTARVQAPLWHPVPPSLACTMLVLTLASCTGEG